MTALIRNDLQEVFDNITLSSAHAGLMLQRKLKKYEDSGEKLIKNELITTISRIQPCELYELAFKRWLGVTAQENNFVTTVATIDGRLFTGLSTGGSLETGVITQHTYGMPMIAGSSVKGAVRQYAEAIQLNAETLAILFGHGEDDAKNDQDGNILENTAGYLVWHDAWWIPNTSEKFPFTKEIVTVHHQDYYNGKQDEATDFDSPTPNQQVAVQGSFFFVIEGDQKWGEFAKLLLEKVLYEKGLGAKASSGYGYFKQAEKTLTNIIADQIQFLEKQRKPEFENLLDELKDKMKKIPKGGGIGGNPLGNELKNLIEISKNWPQESHSALRELAEQIFEHVGADRKKGAAKQLWKTLPQ